MKKINLVFISLIFCQIVVAQTEFGVKGGINISSINDEGRVPDARVTPRIGFNLGGLAHIHLNKTWAIQPEIFYSKEGAKYDFPSYTGKTDLNYVNIPVLVQYMTASGFRLQTGPQLGLLTSAKYEDPNNNESIKNDISKTNVSWAFGFGYLTRSRIGLDARFNLGLSNLYRNGIYAGQIAKSRVGQIGLFYHFKK